MEVHGYTETGSIRATIDGVEWTIPDDVSNNFRRMISIWEGEGNTIPPYIKPEEPVPDVVSARQFKLQLHYDGLLDSVAAWVSSQELPIQIAYNNSGTFVRSEPMMQAGFAGLGVSPEQIDDFFRRASQL